MTARRLFGALFLLMLGACDSVEPTAEIPQQPTGPAPQVSEPVPDLDMTSEQSIHRVYLARHFTPSTDDALQFRLAGAPSLVSATLEAGNLDLRPLAEGEETIVVEAYGASTKVARDSFTVRMERVPLPDLHAYIDQPVEIDLDDHFFELPGDSYRLEGGDGLADFDVANGTLALSPAARGTAAVTVTHVRTGGEETSDGFALSVTPCPTAGGAADSYLPHEVGRVWEYDIAHTFDIHTFEGSARKGRLTWKVSAVRDVRCTSASIDIEESFVGGYAPEGYVDEDIWDLRDTTYTTTRLITVRENGELHIDIPGEGWRAAYVGYVPAVSQPEWLPPAASPEVMVWGGAFTVGSGGERDEIRLQRGVGMTYWSSSTARYWGEAEGSMTLLDTYVE